MGAADALDHHHHGVLRNEKGLLWQEPVASEELSHESIQPARTVA